MSEILGTILLTALTVTLLGAFGAVVISSLADTGTAPTGDFLLEVEPGVRTVDLVYASGSSFDLASASIILRVNDTQTAATYTIVRGATPSLLSPGDLLRLDLSAEMPTPGAGTRVAALVFHTPTNQPVGGATTAVHDAARASFGSGTITLSGVLFHPSPAVADGVTLTTVTARVDSSFGQRYVRDVTINLSAVGGSATARLLDNGEGGDAVAGDGTYTLQFAPASASVPLTAETASVGITLTATDMSGRTANATSTVSLKADPARTGGSGSGSGSGLAVNNKVLGGAAFARVPGSAQVASLYLTNFTFIDEFEVNNDQIAIRVSDYVDPTRTWTAWVYFTYCSGRPAVQSMEFYRDGISGSATYTANSCFPINLTARVDISHPPSSRNMFGATQTWTISGNPSVFSLENATIGGLNGATIVHFGDKTPWTSSKTGLGQADLAWNYKPIPAFTWSVSDKVLTVDARTSFDFEAPIAAYDWNWGDGTTGSGATATKTYATGGNRTVTLTVTDSYGATNSTSAIIAIGNTAPVASFTMSTDGLRVNVSASASYDPDGLITAYRWNWGDGSPDTFGVNSTRLYTSAATRTITLTVTDDANANTLLTQDVTVVNHLPTATLTPSTTSGNASLAVTYTLGGFDTDGNVTSWSLAYGDGTFLNGTALPATPTKTYATLGVYTPTFTVTDNAGGSNVTSATIRVHGFTYTSTTTTLVDGGSLSNVANLARDNGGDVATLTETSSTIARLEPSLLNDRTFTTAPTGWSAPTSGFSMEHETTQGWPAGSMGLRKTTGNPSTLGTLEYSWTKTEPTTSASGTLSLSYRFDATANSTRWVEAYLVKPDGTTLSLGARPWSSSWTNVSFSVAAGQLNAQGTYTLQLVGNLNGNNDRVLFDNVQLSWSDTTTFRFGRDFTVATPTTSDAVHTLQIRYRATSNLEGLRVFTLDSGTFTLRETLLSSTMTTYSRTLTTTETASGLTVRLLDMAQAPDTLASTWEIDYIRVYTVFP